MTTKEILNNNILEQYVLGELDSATSKEIERLRLSEKEIAEYLDDIEKSFEHIGIENSVIPPKHIKANLINLVTKNTDLSKGTRNYKYWIGIAASFAAFFLLGSLWLYSELNSVKEELKVVNNKNEALQENFNGLNKNYRETQYWYLALTDPDAEQYVLRGNTLAPDAKIVSYVNHDKKSVVINTQNLPKLDSDHDYQMWADVDGEMINMGVITKGEPLMAMTYIEDAESLNITIEPAGGNDHPTVERLISNVYLDQKTTP